ncbi:MAG: Hsp33 family molecular chaperone HslO [Ignavibacteriae bacterium HGW-Ignavibacteriae-4]|jgi:molecular chaperone Hsp33|nr:MAG: Hsp33 family molecular chaperone HslO [Ignavibacteriae bacterium HGW-Ignavibacteriae-4]
MKSNEEIKREIRLRDRVIRVLAKDKQIRAIAIKNTVAVKTAQNNHQLGFVPATLLAKLLSAASMIASTLKGEERVVLEMNSNGFVPKLFAEALRVGEVRGYAVQSKDINIEEVKNSDFIGLGLLTVSKVLYNKAEPTNGIIEIVKGDIATDIAYYFTQSEQIPTSLILDVALDENGLISHSGGIMIQALPGATEEDLAMVVDNLQNLDRLSELLKQGKTPEEIIAEVLPFEYTLLDSTQVDFFCRCSKDKYMNSLVTFPHKMIVEMEENNENELVCQYCNAHYNLEKEDFEKLKEITLAKSN